MRRCILIAALAGGLLVSFASIGSAHPGWSRKYGTSCATCHVGFPQLTPFGEAFRRNGYRFPDGADEDYTKVEPVSLGAEGYKKVFPDSIWPADLPGIFPFGFIAEAETSWSPDGAPDNKNSFNNLGGEVAFVGGWTVGETLALYTEVEFARSGGGDTAAEIERLFGVWTPWGPRTKFRVGRFEPEILNISNHRRLGGPKYFMMSGQMADNGFKFEGAQQGVELSGTYNGRCMYAVGVVEGSKNASNDKKDYYASAGYKIGGMRLDGVAEGDDQDALANPTPWRERSATIKGFYYQGNSTLSGGGVQQTDRFQRYGADVKVRFDDLVGIAGAGKWDNDQPVLGSGDSIDANNYWAEFQYVVFPWLMPFFRWEEIDPDGADTVDRYTTSVVFLARANVKGFVEWVYTSGQDLEREVALGFRLGF